MSEDDDEDRDYRALTDEEVDDIARRLDNGEDVDLSRLSKKDRVRVAERRRPGPRI